MNTLEKIETGTPEVQFRMLMDVSRMLGFEIVTGMKSRISPMNQAKDICGSPKRTKKGVLADYVDWLDKRYPGLKHYPSVLKALGRQERIVYCPYCIGNKNGEGTIIWHEPDCTRPR